jgi:hypothetical protein
LLVACESADEQQLIVVHGARADPSAQVLDGILTDACDGGFPEEPDAEDAGSDRVRADRLFRAICAKYVACQGADAESCFAEHSLKWAAILRSGYDARCLGTQLDLFGCRANVACDDELTCAPLVDRQIAHCATTQPRDHR